MASSIEFDQSEDPDLKDLSPEETEIPPRNVIAERLTYGGISAAVLAALLISGEPIVDNLAAWLQSPKNNKPDASDTAPGRISTLPVVDLSDIPEDPSKWPVPPIADIDTFVSTVNTEGLQVGVIPGGLTYNLILPENFRDYPLDEKFFSDVETVLTIVNRALNPETRLNTFNSAIHLEYSLRQGIQADRVNVTEIRSPARPKGFYTAHYVPLPFEDFYISRSEVMKDLAFTLLGFADIYEMANQADIVESEKTKGVIASVTYAFGGVPYDIYKTITNQRLKVLSKEDYESLIEVFMYEYD